MIARVGVMFLDIGEKLDLSKKKVTSRRTIELTAITSKDMPKAYMNTIVYPEFELFIRNLYASSTTRY